MLLFAFASVLFRMVHIQRSAQWMLQQSASQQPVSRYMAPRRNAIVSMLVVSKHHDEEGGGRYQQGLCKLGAAIDRFASIDRVVMLVRLQARSPPPLSRWTCADGLHIRCCP